MTSFPKILIYLAISASFTACVTTRDQLNEERGIHADNEESAPSRAAPTHSVQSEDLPTRGRGAETEIAKRPETAPDKNDANISSRPATAPGPYSPPAPQAAVPAPARDASTYGAEELRSEVARLTGEVEELRHEREINEKGKSEEEKKAQARVAELEKKLKELQPDTPKVPEGKTPLEAAKEAFSSDRYDDAVLFASQVLEKSDTGKEAEEATYIRGEAYYKKQQFNKAIVDFSHFPEKFQKSSYHPKALLRIAECFEMMGRKDDAKAFYSDLLDKFPKTGEGKLAKKRLKLKK
ncbi:MAG: tetratricopeptide repeat protein [Bdellovibrionales bacterium]|nr:tetratricopeptide repeat protein [Oligoflexia bacterium]